MPLTTTKLIKQYKRVVQDEAKQTALPASAYLRALIVDALSRTERDVYHHLAKSNAPQRAADVARRFNLSPTHALNVLNRLHGYGLIEKTPNVSSTHRREFSWSVLR